MTKKSPFHYFRTSPEIIRLTLMVCVRFPLSLRNVEDLLHERGIDEWKCPFDQHSVVDKSFSSVTRQYMA